MFIQVKTRQGDSHERVVGAGAAERKGGNRTRRLRPAAGSGPILRSLAHQDVLSINLQSVRYAGRVIRRQCGLAVSLN